ncbi:MAG: bifunctional methylenetetrahydrofolate dehydrogenase/methenyltetrahydrofolate cyclohydrolase FolD [Deltaproteobacteria bacterium]|nr:MAG: bifunctional methylenetetrahydrofolate dehydrogenase/methenyltetrahydrofolate cyclohydrolase FolD [Deltaproteobacteria bacterium]
MSAQILDGRALARQLNTALAARVPELPRPPGLAVILVGADPASQVYVRRKGQVAERLGFLHQQHDLPAETSREDLLARIHQVVADPNIDGLLVQLPLPAHLDASEIMDAVPVTHDVDGFTPPNTGLLSQGRANLVACTPLGIMRLLEHAAVPLSGREAVVIGRSNIVGRPMAMLLEQAGCTVTLCHSRTANVAAHCRRADVVVAAVGVAQMVRADWIKPGATVIDVGMNRGSDGRLVGDVAFDEVVGHAGAITPVPGGVGPMTIAMLMENTWRASCRAQGIS